MNDYLNTVLVYDGRDNPSLTEFNMQGLTPGKTYGFSVVAFNFNGKGPASEVTPMTTCTAPSGQLEPKVFATTAESISFRWQAPL